MKKRDLIRLPLGAFLIKDKYYKYVLQKFRSSHDESIVYIIREHGTLSGGTILLSEELENVFEHTSDYKQIELHFHAFVGGLSCGGDYSYRIYRDLAFIEKSSYRKWLDQMEFSELEKPIQNGQ